MSNLYAAFNTHKLKLIAVCETIEQCVAHADIKCKEDNFLVVDPSCYHWAQFNDNERHTFYRNLTGRELNTSDDVMQVRALNDALMNQPLDETSLEVLNAKRPEIPLVHAEGKGYSRNSRVVQQPTNPQEDIMAKKATAKAKTNTKSKTAPKSKSKSKAAPKTAPKAKVASAPGQPREGTISAKLWEVFDGMTKSLKRTVTIGEVMDSGKVEGIKTASVRAGYAHWKKFHGISGRVAKPE